MDQKTKICEDNTAKPAQRDLHLRFSSNGFTTFKSADDFAKANKGRLLEIKDLPSLSPQALKSLFMQVVLEGDSFWLGDKKGAVESSSIKIRTIEETFNIGVRFYGGSEYLVLAPAHIEKPVKGLSVRADKTEAEYVSIGISPLTLLGSSAPKAAIIREFPIVKSDAIRGLRQ